MQISKHFSLRELTKSQMAERLGINNSPSPEHIVNLSHLTEHLLEPLRALVQKPIVVTSGYRCPALSEAIGSSAKSQHCVGSAVDIEVEIARLWRQQLPHMLPVFIHQDEVLKEALAFKNVGYNCAPFSVIKDDFQALISWLKLHFNKVAE